MMQRHTMTHRTPLPIRRKNMHLPQIIQRLRKLPQPRCTHPIIIGDQN